MTRMRGIVAAAAATWTAALAWSGCSSDCPAVGDVCAANCPPVYGVPLQVEEDAAACTLDRGVISCRGWGEDAELAEGAGCIKRTEDGLIYRLDSASQERWLTIAGGWEECTPAEAEVLSGAGECPEEE